jgi:hypothetical protein
MSDTPPTPTISVRLTVGSRVTLAEDVDVDSTGGSTATVTFEDTVSQYVPQTGKLEFEESDIGRAEFLSLLQEAGSVHIITDYNEGE